MIPLNTKELERIYQLNTDTLEDFRYRIKEVIHYFSVLTVPELSENYRNEAKKEIGRHLRLLRQSANSFEDMLEEFRDEIDDMKRRRKDAIAKKEKKRRLAERIQKEKFLRRGTRLEKL